MLLLMISLLAVPPPTGLARAERLYNQARYEDAQKTLGSTCEGTDAAACERLRGFIHVALGQEREAMAAFARLLTADPKATLGDDVAPKLHDLFDEVRKTLSGLAALELSSIESEQHGPWTLRVKPPRAADIEAMMVFVAPKEVQNFEGVALRPHGENWTGDWFPRGTASGPVRYFIEVHLANGVMIAAGSSAMPREAAVNEVVHATAVKSGSGGLDSGLDQPIPPGSSALASPTILGLPRWAFWSIVGGGAALLAGSITAAVLLTRSPSPGTVVVGIQFEDGGTR
jgi:hypothetical protein